jgi:hypothetical protein
MSSDEEASFRPWKDTVVVRLELEPGEPGEPPSGSIAIEAKPAERFSGWIELMAAINAAHLRDDTGSP